MQERRPRFVGDLRGFLLLPAGLSGLFGGLDLAGRPARRRRRGGGTGVRLGLDCGIYNVGTVPRRARRRGYGTALIAAQAYAARARGCRTASLQSTPMAEGGYAAVGFRVWVPATPSRR